MAGTTKVNNLQLGDSVTASHNFVLQTLVNGSMKLARGNVGATTQDIMTVDLNGNVGGKVVGTGGVQTIDGEKSFTMPLNVVGSNLKMRRLDSSTASHYIGFYNDGGETLDGYFGYGSTGKNMSITNQAGTLSFDATSLSFAPPATFGNTVRLGANASYSHAFFLGNTDRHLRCDVATAAIEFVNSTNTAVVQSFHDNGDIVGNGNVTAYSDERVKTNWRDFGLDFVQRLAGVKSGVYDRTDQVMTQVGVSAQSLREVMPNAVLEDAEGMLSVAYGNAALAACVELAKEVVELRRRLQLLEG